MTVARSTVRTAASGLLLAATLLAVPLAAAGPAAAEGPRNEREAAVCRQVLGSLLGFAGPTASAVCAVQGKEGASTTG
ncbi:hypothetical protein ACFCX4_26140 [Kitasatospora sp. NPDC056327]|uniref:hypothetical protein n=1 Tax=Kitasatospora sp. NPDC056327 TaxID=3345785 RepID=UPI0035D5F4C2